ncbi:MAG TPA: flagellar motor protein MotB [Terriglobales bacterium]|nr:flagellar motor protein MotB [Terriglobales bacterium]
MARKKKHAGHVNHERWLISYADFITLLFAFFVVMYASSQVDRAKTIQLAAAIQAAFQQMGMFHPSSLEPPIESLGSPSSSPAPPSLATVTPSPELAQLTAQAGVLSSGRDLRLLATELKKELAPEILKHQIQVNIRKEGVVVSLLEAGFYPSGSAQLLPGSDAILARIAAVVRHHPNAVRIEGHTDNVPIHNAQFDSNWALSTTRATEMVKIFITRFHFPPDRLSAAGYAQYHPVATNATAAGRQRNRRVDIVILPPPGTAWLPLPDDATADIVPNRAQTATRRLTPSVAPVEKSPPLPEGAKDKAKGRSGAIP